MHACVCSNHPISPLIILQSSNLLAHANCTLFCAPNAQKKTGSQQGKKTIFLDV